MEKRYRLPKRFAEKWLIALRSGEYKQGRGYLLHNDRFCCLGVAGCVVGINVQYLEDMCTLGSLPVTQGIPTELLKDFELVGKLVDLNDSKRQNFDQIADWIEQNVEFY